MHRPTVGWIALALLFAAIGLRLWYPTDVSMADSCLRPALVMGLLWLALPQLSQLPRWLTIAVAVAALVVLWRPKALLLVLPILAALWFLRPRRPGR
jgi:hypothetical protein